MVVLSGGSGVGQTFELSERRFTALRLRRPRRICNCDALTSLAGWPRRRASRVAGQCILQFVRMLQLHVAHHPAPLIEMGKSPENNEYERRGGDDALALKVQYQRRRGRDLLLQQRHDDDDDRVLLQFHKPTMP